MSSDTVESQLQDIREQLDVQADAISRLVGVVSGLEGVDAALLGSYVLRLKRLHGPTVEAPATGAAAAAPGSSERDSAQAVPQ